MRSLIFLVLFVLVVLVKVFLVHVSDSTNASRASGYNRPLAH